MSIAYDLFAETNPAFCAFGIVSFCRKYEAASIKSPDLALLYLALPLSLSDDLEISFDATNATTGILLWLARYPDVRLDLGMRLDASKEIVTNALRFGLSVRALSLGTDGTVSLGDKRPAAAPVTKLPDGPKRAIKRAERLGTWMGNTGSAGAVFSTFGVIP